MRYREISEAPIEDLTHVGDWTKSSSFSHAQDRKLLTNPKALQKITAQWEKTPVDFNVYLVNNADGRKWGEIGAVDQEWLETNLPKTAPEFKYNPQAVNLLFMNNSGSERVPMTGWIMAHRFGHAVSRPSRNGSGRQFYEFTEARDYILQAVGPILKDGYGYGNVPDNDRDYRRMNDSDKLLTAFYEQIGTMRSARMGNIRNEAEFTLELLAQFMLTGRIKFNPIPKTFKVGRSGYVRFTSPEGDMDYYNGVLDDLAETLEHTFLNLLGACIGKILVM